MSDDSSCVSEVTTALSRFRMQKTSKEGTPSSDGTTLDSPGTPGGDSPDSPVVNSIKLKTITNPVTSTSNASNFKIPIVGYEIMEERARFTVYKLRIENCISGDCWFVFRRYTDFVRLFSKLKSNFPSIKLSLPRKRWFGDNFDSTFLEERIKGLQEFVDTILQHQELCSTPCVQDFFCLNEPPSYAESIEESRAIFEALEETIYHLRCQVREKDIEMTRMKNQLVTEIKRKEKLAQLLREKSCPHCGKEIVTSPGSTSTPKKTDSIGAGNPVLPNTDASPVKLDSSLQPLVL